MPRADRRLADPKEQLRLEAIVPTSLAWHPPPGWNASKTASPGGEVGFFLHMYNRPFAVVNVARGART